MTGRINPYRCAHCGCDEPILGIDNKLYCDNCGMCLEPTLPSHAQASKLEGGLTMTEKNKIDCNKTPHWIEHPHEIEQVAAMNIIQQHYADKPNKMEAIAAMFGKKLNEDFKAVIWDSVIECKFTHNGLKIKMSDGWRTTNGGWLSCLLTGEAKIVED